MTNITSLTPKKNYFDSIKGVSNKVRGNGTNYKLREHRQRFFFPDEWMKFEDSLKKSQLVTFKTLINTGARINEVRNIKVSDIDFERQGVILRVTKRIIKRIGIDKTGTRKIRVIPISSQFTKYLRKVVKEYNLKDDDYLPILSTGSANIAMKKALVKAGITDSEMFSIHNIRKTTETWLLALSVDFAKLTKHFGHSPLIAMKHYVSPEFFNWDDKKSMRMIIGDLYS